jgi:hypothetical protein
MTRKYRNDSLSVLSESKSASTRWSAHRCRYGTKDLALMDMGRSAAVTIRSWRRHRFAGNCYGLGVRMDTLISEPAQTYACRSR